MNSKSNNIRRKRPILRIVVISVIILILAGGIISFKNFNRWLSNALIKSYESTIISDVYELKFEKLKANVFTGSIRVSNVVLQPREKPLKYYPYINSSIRLKAEKLTLENVEILTLLLSDRLIVEKISITSPDIKILLDGVKNNILPFKDTIQVAKADDDKMKKEIGTYILKEFQLINASFHVANKVKKRELDIKDFNISFYDMLIDQQPGEYSTSFDHVMLLVGEFDGKMHKEALKQIGFDDFEISVDSLSMLFTPDTLTYKFHDLKAGMHNLDILTADSLFQISMQSFKLSYIDKSIKLNDVSFNPNVSHAILQSDYKYQHTEYSGAVGSVIFNNVDFDSLIYANKLFIDEIVIDRVKASIYKDNTKPINTNRLPIYLGQTVRSIPIPLLIKVVKATDVNLENTERKPDGSIAKVNLTNANVVLSNITNLLANDNLVMSADAYIEDKVHFKATLSFSYQKPQFSFEGVVDEFNLPDMNPLIKAYTPAEIKQGKADKISFSGVALEANASGTMTFLYHDLKVDLKIQEKAKWKSSVVAFTANTVLNSSNPSAANFPPRVVKFHIDRNMNKGFVNVIIKSVLSGLKETMIMSKENRKEYQEARKKMQEENK